MKFVFFLFIISIALFLYFNNKKEEIEKQLYPNNDIQSQELNFQNQSMAELREKLNQIPIAVVSSPPEASNHQLSPHQERKAAFEFEKNLYENFVNKKLSLEELETGREILLATKRRLQIPIGEKETLPFTHLVMMIYHDLPMQFDETSTSELTKLLENLNSEEIKKIYMHELSEERLKQGLIYGQ